MGNVDRPHPSPRNRPLDVCRSTSRREDEARRPTADRRPKVTVWLQLIQSEPLVAMGDQNRYGRRRVRRSQRHVSNRDRSRSPASRGELNRFGSSPPGLFYLGGAIPMAWFWWRVLAALGQHPGWRTTLHAYFLGHLGKYVPGKALVVVIRVGLLRPRVSSVRLTMASVLVETLTLMAVGAALGAALLRFRAPLGWARHRDGLDHGRRRRRADVSVRRATAGRQSGRRPPRD